VNVLLLCLLGCGEEEIRSYQAPKSAPYVEPDLFSRLTAAPPSAVPTSPGITWDVPDTWTETPSTSGFMLAVFEAKGETGDARITVSQLTGEGGGVLANINRWRGQVGLGPIQAFEEQPMTPIQVAGQTAGVIDLAAPVGSNTGLERLIVVFIPRPQENLTWYFKMIGPANALDEHKPAFIRFLESVKFGAEPAADAASNFEGGDADATGVGGQ
jgi:hypothetical protein